MSFDVADGDCLALVGPNGSGKTTLLECIAGIRKIDSGRIQFNCIDVTRLPPEKRQVGYVPQDCLLFPHLTVDQNVAFGQRGPSSDADGEARQMMKWLGISHLAGRRAKDLSGGEKQKVALARALATRPRVLLLDEPFSSVDRASRARLLEETKRNLEEIGETFGLASVYVTHDLSEAQMMSGRVAIMNNGRIEQSGSWEQALETPTSTFVADFMGFNVLQGTVTSREDGFVVAEVEHKPIWGVATGSRIGQRVVVVVRPQAVSLSAEEHDGKRRFSRCKCNVLEAVITHMRRSGAVTYVSLDAGFPMNVEISSESVDELGLSVGSRVYAHFRASDTSILGA